MKIISLTTSYPAFKGHLQSPFVHNLMKEITKKGHQVQVLCPYYFDSKSKKEVIDNVNVDRFQYICPKRFQTLTSKGGVASQLKTSWLARMQLPFFMASLFLKSKRYAKKSDVIHAQWALTGLVGLFLKKLYKKPLILTTRGADITMSIKSKLLRKVLVYVLKNCDYITTICGDFKEQMVKLGINKNKIIRISNGIDPNFKPKNKKKIRKIIGLPQNKKIILFVGWLIKRKGIDYLIKAIPGIIKNHPDALFVIVGEGMLKNDIKNGITTKKLEKNVILVGSKNPKDIPNWMGAADIFILPTLSDGRPNTVIEAMASGVATITTNVPGPAEVVKHKKTGLLINPKSSKEIEKVVTELLNDSKLIKKYAKAGAKHIQNQGWTWEACAEKYLKIYCKSLKN